VNVSQSAPVGPFTVPLLRNALAIVALPVAVRTFEGSTEPSGPSRVPLNEFSRPPLDSVVSAPNSASSASNNNTDLLPTASVPLKS